ncbi:MAG: hypothetical protein R3277_07150 [Brumimicrobium sp.]|nr:hypothetical protein [Brumimicrobium sp.]
MKTTIFILILFFLAPLSFAQNDTIKKKDTLSYRIIKTDGSEIIGKIISEDRREVLVLTSDNREIYIPQHVIKEIIPIKKEEFNSLGQFVGEDKFATRYFITTNGLPIKKGEHYIQWNLFGPDFQFAVGKNFGLGVMTSWMGIPIIGTVKKSFRLGENTHLAIGGLLGSGTWAAPDYGGALPFATFSVGNRRVNAAVSAGYGAIWLSGDGSGRALTSLAGMVKISPKLSFVFDSFILLPNTYVRYGSKYYNPLIALIIPGMRWHQDEGKAFQFGFTGVVVENELFPLPIPMVQWYRSL